MPDWEWVQGEYDSALWDLSPAIGDPNGPMLTVALDHVGLDFVTTDKAAGVLERRTRSATMWRDKMSDTQRAEAIDAVAGELMRLAESVEDWLPTSVTRVEDRIDMTVSLWPSFQATSGNHAPKRPSARDVLSRLLDLAQ